MYPNMLRGALLTLALVTLAGGEIFTALVELERVLHAENSLARDLRSYIKQEEARLEQLKLIADDYEAHSSNALGQPDSYLGNPVNAFLLVKRFTSDWEKVETLIRNNTSDVFLNNIAGTLAYFPDNEDLTGAATALLRLQDTYALSTEKLARGEIQGVQMSEELSAPDCFELGRIAYNGGDYYHTILWMTQAYEQIRARDQPDPNDPDIGLTLDYLAYATYVSDVSAEDCFELGRLSYLEKDYYHTVTWMQAALQQWEQEGGDKSVSRVEILDYLAFSTSMQGNIRAALNLTIEWLRVEPSHVRAMNNKKYYEEMLAEQEGGKRKGDDGELPEPIRNERQLDDYRASYEFQTYEALCRGETHIVNNDAHKLTCQYVHNHPYWTIRPLKEETMYLSPWIAVYHDILVDSEIAKIKELASPRLKRATVQNPQTGNLETAYYRVSKSAWLKDIEDDLIARVSYKVNACSGLSLDTAEELQVVNYGIGGHYEPHYDFARKREINTFDEWRGNRIATAIFYKDDVWSEYYKINGNRIASMKIFKDEQTSFREGAGNRIATLIYYMSDVEAGGATVFPELGIQLWPRKGSMAFWYNLMRSGEGDYRTRHAACPVLTGSKWVCNKWIHERGQEFIFKCDTNPEI